MIEDSLSLGVFPLILFAFQPVAFTTFFGNLLCNHADEKGGTIAQNRPVLVGLMGS